jgi:hypothetical protein
MSKNSSGGKTLRRMSFVIHATRGVMRDQKTRRKTMLVLLLAALAFVLSGTTFLQTTLDPREHPGWFISFWIVCGWLTLTALLLAIFDLLIVQVEARKAERRLREKFAQSNLRKREDG